MVKKKSLNRICLSLLVKTKTFPLEVKNDGYPQKNLPLSHL